MNMEENNMKSYETPELIVTELDLEDVVASEFREQGDTDIGWDGGWTSGINGIN